MPNGIGAFASWFINIRNRRIFPQCEECDGSGECGHCYGMGWCERCQDNKGKCHVCEGLRYIVTEEPRES